MQRSSLNQHLCSKNFVDSPNGFVVQLNLPPTTSFTVQDAKRQMHIFYQCTYKPDKKNLLFGSPNQNIELFLAIQKFVICSKQFTP